MSELKMVDLTIFNSLYFIFILFFISEPGIRVNMTSHVTIRNFYTLITVTLSHDHVS